MAGTSQNVANQVLSKIFGTTNFTPPVTIYIALTTAAPTTTGAGSIVEPTAAQYNAYARVAVTNNTTNWPAASAGALSNGTTITFPTSTGGASSPVTVTNVAAMDAVSGGTLWAFAPLPGGTQVASGQTPQLGVGALVWTVV